MAQKIGLNRYATIRCFDDVLRLTGNTDERYLKIAVRRMREILRSGRFDAVYSEFSPPAIIAATAEGIPLFGTTSLPTQPSFANNPSTAADVNNVLRSLALQPVRSPENLFLRPKKRFVPSCHALEPFPESSSITYTGPFSALPTTAERTTLQKQDAVVAYLGNGGITPHRAVQTLKAALKGSSPTAYVAGLPEGADGNVRTAPSFDFAKLLPCAVAFLNHG